MKVSEAHVNQRLHPLPDLRNILKNRQRFGNWRLQQVGDRTSLVLYGQRFLVVAPASADFADDINIRQEVHLNAALAFSLTGFAASAGDIKREPAWFVAALARFREHGVEIANVREDSRVSCRIRAWRPANGRLVNANNLVDILRATDCFVRASLLARVIKRLGEGTIEDVVHQR